MPCSTPHSYETHTVTVPDPKMESAFCAAMSFIMQDCETTPEIDSRINNITLRSGCKHLHEYYWTHCASDKERIRKGLHGMSQDEMDLLKRMIKEGEL